MQSLLQQNQHLKQIMFKCEQQIHQLRKIGQDHQQQIDNLLKFNQRLLSIIESQMPNKAVSRKSSGSLQPIDEINEKDDTVLMQHHFSNHQNPINDKLEHVQPEDIEKISQDNEQDYKKHVNMPRTLNQIHNNNYQSISSELRLNTTESHSLNPTQNKSRNDSQDQNVVYRQQNQSLIGMPKYLKLEKGLDNERYGKDMSHSFEEMKNTGTGFTLDRLYTNTSKISQQIGKFNEEIKQSPQMTRQQLAEYFSSIHHLIQEYKQDFNTEEYMHLCSIIKNDLQTDLQELMAISQEKMRFYSMKEKEIMQLRKSLLQFSPAQKLLEIMKKLNISQETEQMIVQKVCPWVQKSRNNTRVKQVRQKHQVAR